MKLLSKTSMDTVYQIELGQGELDLLISALGGSDDKMRQSIAAIYSVNLPRNYAVGCLYAALQKVAGWTED